MITLYFNLETPWHQYVGICKLDCGGRAVFGALFRNFPHLIKVLISEAVTKLKGGAQQ